MRHEDTRCRDVADSNDASGRPVHFAGVSALAARRNMRELRIGIAFGGVWCIINYNYTKWLSKTLPIILANTKPSWILVGFGAWSVYYARILLRSP